jgi:hypothetical protein
LLEQLRELELERRGTEHSLHTKLAQEFQGKVRIHLGASGGVGRIILQWTLEKSGVVWIKLVQDRVNGGLSQHNKSGRAVGDKTLLFKPS